MSNPEGSNGNGENLPCGDAIVGLFPLEVGKIIAGSDELSELMITPFVNAAALDLSALSPEDKEQVLESRQRSAKAWLSYACLEENERILEGLTKQQWEQRKNQRILGVLNQAAYHYSED